MKRQRNILIVSRKKSKIFPGKLIASCSENVFLFFGKSRPFQIDHQPCKDKS